MKEKIFRDNEERSFPVKSCGFSVSEKLFTSREVAKDFLASLGHLQQQASDSGEKPNEITQGGASLQNRKSQYIWGECTKTSPTDTLVQGQDIPTGGQYFVCSECGKIFRDKSSFIVHHRKGHQEYGECGTSLRQSLRISHICCTCIAWAQNESFHVD